jgi:GMP synthase-like glutamine amidotransferase
LHGDHVVFLVDGIVEDVQFVGQLDGCHNQGVYMPGRILTLQGHPEFDMWIEKVCLELVGKRVGWNAGFTAAAVAAADAPDDAGLAAELIMAFFLQD